MSTADFAAPLAAYVLQASLLLGLGLALPALFRLRDPRARLGYWHGLLIAVLALPLLQPRPALPAFAEGLVVTDRWLGQLAAAGGAQGGRTPQEMLLLALGAGAFLRLSWLALGLIRLRSLRREARPAALEPEVAAVAGGIGGRAVRRARVLVSPRVESPVTFGWREPAVLLPESVLALPPAAQRGIVCHELLHVRRRDWLASLFEEAVRALLWFHPMVWMLLSRISLSREQVVDREAVRRTGSRRAYLEALRAVASRSRQTGASVVSGTGLPFFHRGHLRERVAHLCKEVPMSRPRIATLVTTFAALLAVTAFLGALAFPMAGTAWAGEPLEITNDIQRPRLVNQVQPVYPESEKEQKIEGTVVIKAVINESGAVEDPAVHKSSGSANLDRSAVDAVSQWTFTPALKAGKPVAVYYNLTLNFQVE